jgi:hypothetical protein
MTSAHADQARNINAAMAPPFPRRLPETSAVPRLAIAALNYTASLSLILDGLTGKAQRTFFVFDPRMPHDRRAALSQSSAVLVTRELHTEPMQMLVRECAQARVPYYIYVDDNFFVLADENRDFIWFKSHECARIFALAAGVASTSPRLLDYVRTHRLNQRGIRLTPVVPNWLRSNKPCADDGSLRIAFCGAPFRSSDFKTNIEPAIAGLVDSGIRISIIAREGTELSMLRQRGVEIATPPWSASFPDFIRQWQRFQPNLVIHPKADTANAPYKTPSIIIIALLLGAVPIVAREPAFEGVENSGTRIVEGQDAWRVAIAELASFNARRAAYTELGRFCAKTFTPDANRMAIVEMLSTQG